MTKVVGKNTDLNTADGALGACARFEPIKKILSRCDEKTLEYARTMTAAAA